MKITIGEWKTRDGRKAVVGAENPSAHSGCRFIGWIDGWSGDWCEDGKRDCLQRSMDLIAPWADPVPWDWSTTPPWINWIAMWDDGEWFMFDKEPVLEAAHIGWIGSGAKSVSHAIPNSHAPKWSGDWKLSKTMRPGYKEVK